MQVVKGGLECKVFIEVSIDVIKLWKVVVYQRTF